jgi:hypothetical protein
MDDTVILAICFPLVIVGMVLVIMWGMSIVGPHRNGRGQDESEQIHSREVCEDRESRWCMVEKGERAHPRS